MSGDTKGELKGFGPITAESVERVLTVLATERRDLSDAAVITYAAKCRPETLRSANTVSKIVHVIRSCKKVEAECAALLFSALVYVFRGGKAVPLEVVETYLVDVLRAQVWSDMDAVAPCHAAMTRVLEDRAMPAPLRALVVQTLQREFFEVRRVELSAVPRRAAALLTSCLWLSRARVAAAVAVRQWMQSTASLRLVHAVLPLLANAVTLAEKHESADALESSSDAKLANERVMRELLASRGTGSVAEVLESALAEIAASDARLASEVMQWVVSSTVRGAHSTLPSGILVHAFGSESHPVEMLASSFGRALSASLADVKPDSAAAAAALPKLARAALARCRGTAAAAAAAALTGSLLDDIGSVNKEDAVLARVLVHAAAVVEAAQLEAAGEIGGRGLAALQRAALASAQGLAARCQSALEAGALADILRRILALPPVPGMNVPADNAAVNLARSGVPVTEDAFTRIAVLRLSGLPLSGDECLALLEAVVGRALRFQGRNTTPLQNTKILAALFRIAGFGEAETGTAMFRARTFWRCTTLALGVLALGSSAMVEAAIEQSATLRVLVESTVCDDWALFALDPLVVAAEAEAKKRDADVQLAYRTATGRDVPDDSIAADIFGPVRTPPPPVRDLIRARAEEWALAQHIRELCAGALVSRLFRHVAKLRGSAQCLVAVLERDPRSAASLDRDLQRDVVVEILRSSAVARAGARSGGEARAESSYRGAAVVDELTARAVTADPHILIDLIARAAPDRVSHVESLRSLWYIDALLNALRSAFAKTQQYATASSSVAAASGNLFDSEPAAMKDTTTEPNDQPNGSEASRFASFLAKHLISGLEGRANSALVTRLAVETLCRVASVDTRPVALGLLCRVLAQLGVSACCINSEYEGNMTLKTVAARFVSVDAMSMADIDAVLAEALRQESRNPPRNSRDSCASDRGAGSSRGEESLPTGREVDESVCARSDGSRASADTAPASSTRSSLHSVLLEGEGEPGDALVPGKDATPMSLGLARVETRVGHCDVRTALASAAAHAAVVLDGQCRSVFREEISAVESSSLLLSYRAARMVLRVDAPASLRTLAEREIERRSSARVPSHPSTSERERELRVSDRARCDDASDALLPAWAAELRDAAQRIDTALNLHDPVDAHARTESTSHSSVDARGDAEMREGAPAEFARKRRWSASSPRRSAPEQRLRVAHDTVYEEPVTPRALYTAVSLMSRLRRVWFRPENRTLPPLQSAVRDLPSSRLAAVRSAAAASDLRTDGIPDGAASIVSLRNVVEGVVRSTTRLLVTDTLPCTFETDSMDDSDSDAAESGAVALRVGSGRDSELAVHSGAIAAAAAILGTVASASEARAEAVQRILERIAVSASAAREHRCRTVALALLSVLCPRHAVDGALTVDTDRLVPPTPDLFAARQILARSVAPEPKRINQLIARSPVAAKTALHAAIARAAHISRQTADAALEDEGVQALVAALHIALAAARQWNMLADAARIANVAEKCLGGFLAAKVHPEAFQVLAFAWIQTVASLRVLGAPVNMNGALIAVVAPLLQGNTLAEAALNQLRAEAQKLQALR